MSEHVQHEATKAKRRREPFWDNARLFCIALVVAGHAVQPMSRETDLAYAVYLLIYTFHMPAFAIASGFFSKAGEPTRKAMTRVITDIVAPYLIFQLIWSLIESAVDGALHIDIFTPSWTLWFLIALAVFRLLLPYLALLRWPVLWTLLISLSAGALPNLDSTLALDRTLSLLPFFVIGWYIRDRGVVERFRLLAHRPWWVRTAAAGLMVGVGVITYVFAEVFRDENLQRWFFFKQTYDQLTTPDGSEPGAWGALIRLGVIAIALVMCAAFFTLIPRGEHWFTSYGRYTLYVYLLHTFVLYPIREITDADGRNITLGLEPQWLWLIIALVASALITVALASKPVRRITRPLIEPNISWLLAKDSPKRG